jgi:hypothetical protein
MRPVEPGDAELLAPRLREADIAEILAASNMTPLQALESGAKNSMLSWTATIDDEIICMLGVTPISLLNGIGCPWLLGSNLIDKHAGAFIKTSAAYIPRMLEVFPHLFNLVDARNKKAIRWLKRAGFLVHEPIEHGPHNMMFHPFEIKI